MKASQFLQLLLIAAIWGASHVLMRIAVPALGPELSIVFRVILAMLTLTAVLGFRKRIFPVRPLLKKYGIAFLWVGLVNMALPFLLFAFATRHLPSAYLVIINAMVPIFSGSFAALFLGEKFGARRWISVGLGMTGVALLKEFGSVSEMTSEVMWALVMAIAAAASYGIGTVAIRIQAKNVPPDQLVWGAHGAVLLLFIPLMLHLFYEPPVLTAGPYGWGAVVASIIVLGVFASGFAFLIFYRLVSEIGAFQASLSTFIMPFFGLLWGVLFLNETITAGMVVGAVLVISSALLFVRGGSTNRKTR
jgi:drug/metabolite transporter (DMT)-like permease